MAIARSNDVRVGSKPEKLYASICFPLFTRYCSLIPGLDVKLSNDHPCRAHCSAHRRLLPARSPGSGGAQANSLSAGAGGRWKIVAGRTAEVVEGNIRAAAENRINSDTLIIARTDAREVYGLDEALRRGERYARAGADALFIKAPTSVEEMRTIGRAFDVPQLANMLEGGRTQLLRPSELEDLGFRIVIYGISPLMHAVRAMQEVLSSLSNGEISFAGGGVGFEEYKSIVGFDRWAEIENRYQPENRSTT